MLHPDLTLEKGLKEIGEIQAAWQLYLATDNLFFAEQKQIREFLNEVYQNEELIKDEHLFEINAKKVEIGSERYKKILRTITKRQNLIFQHSLYKFLKEISTNDICSWITKHREDINSVFIEALMNAVEHGTQFGSTGEIVASTLIGTDGLLATVNQNRPALTIDKLTSIQPENRKAVLYISEHKQPRGYGFYNYLDPKNAYIWFENSRKNSNFRIIILETKERLEKLGT